MIPKIIHYCWFSNDPFPKKIELCINSWRHFLPDYKLKLWNRDNFPEGKSKWVDEALAAKKYAFAADYVRAYALYNEGGIYLDSDVEVLKSFNDLLHLPYFIGKEIENPIEAAVMGASKGLEIFKHILDYYDCRNFIKGHNEYDITPMPQIINNTILKNQEIVFVENAAEISSSKKKIYVLPSDFFSPKSYLTGELNLTSNTYSIHHFSASWVAPKDKRVLQLVYILNKLFGRQKYEMLIKFWHSLKRR